MVTKMDKKEVKKLINDYRACKDEIKGVEDSMYETKDEIVTTFIRSFKDWIYEVEEKEELRDRFFHFDSTTILKDGIKVHIRRRSLYKEMLKTIANMGFIFTHIRYDIGNKKFRLILNINHELCKNLGDKTTREHFSSLIQTYNKLKEKREELGDKLDGYWKRFDFNTFSLSRFDFKIKKDHIEMELSGNSIPRSIAKKLQSYDLMIFRTEYNTEDDFVTVFLNLREDD